MKYFLILFSFMLGIILTILPLPHWAIWLRPQWMMMIVLFWVMMMPFQCGVIFAWIVGLLTDLIVDAPLCAHALGFVILTYFFLKFQRIIFHAPLFQQTFYIGLFAVASVFLQSIVFHLSGYTVYLGFNLLSVLTTMIVWPGVCYFLNGFLDERAKQFPN